VKDLKVLRARIESDLADAEFEQFALSLGCAPQRLETLNSDVASSRRALREIDSAIERGAEQQRRQEQERAERLRTRIKLKDSDVNTTFAALVARFHN